MAEMCWVTFPGVGWLVGWLVGYTLSRRERGVADAYIHVGEKPRWWGRLRRPRDSNRIDVVELSRVESSRLWSR